MSKEREPLYICENCDKGTDAGYFDKETGQTLCHNCFNERQRSFKDQRIADLEAKLAECENKVKGFVELFDKKQHENYEQFCEIQQLKQQLAEKAEQVKQLKLDLGMFKSVNEFLNSYGIEKAREVLLQTEKTKNQDKISFALEQLEKVRKSIKNLHGQKNCKIGNSYIQKKDKLYNKYIIELDVLEEVLEIFDNQIKQLKEMK